MIRKKRATTSSEKCSFHFYCLNLLACSYMVGANGHRRLLFLSLSEQRDVCEWPRGHLHLRLSSQLHWQPLRDIGWVPGIGRVTLNIFLSYEWFHNLTTFTTFAVFIWSHPQYGSLQGSRHMYTADSHMMAGSRAENKSPWALTVNYSGVAKEYKDCMLCESTNASLLCPFVRCYAAV